MNRRGLLKMIGLAPAAVAGASVEPSLVGLTGAFGVMHQYAPPEANVSTPFNMPDNANGSGMSAETAFKAWQAVSGLRVPAHTLEQIKRQARYVTALDPDIASLRSYSLVAKMRLQTDRNVELRMREVEEELEMRWKRSAFEKAFGFDVW